MPIFGVRANTNQNNNTVSDISVLMCAGRRVGKTAIMAAIQEIINNPRNTQGVLSTGRVMCSLKASKNNGTDYLADFVQKRQDAFNNWSSPFYYAEESTQNKKDDGANTTANSDVSDYFGDIHLQTAQGQHPKKVMSISFKDPRGEDFSTPAMKQNVTDWMKDSQIILMMIDMPRLMEMDENFKQGGYHEDFNKPEEISNLLITAWQGNTVPRMVLFVPVKCELYMAQGRGEEMIERIQKGYSKLLKFLTNSKSSHLYTTAIVPCETMGGLEFRKFVPYRDNEGKKTGKMRSVYAYRRDANGERPYQPRYCEQLVLYILRYIFGLSQQKQQRQGLLAYFNKLPNVADLNFTSEEISKSMIRDADGFRILYDPMGFLH